MLGDRFHIFLNHGFNHLQLRRFEALVANKFNREQVVFCLGSAFHHMNMDGCVVIGVKQESVSKQRKYRWHVFHNFLQK